MNTDALRRLAIDKALGELSDDAAELLDAYVADHPEAASILAEADETLTVVHSALVDEHAEEARESMPPLNLSSHTRAAPRPRAASANQVYLWSRRTAVAAIILLAFLLGTRFSNQAPERGASHEQYVNSQPLVEAQPDREGFWSIDRMLDAERPAASPRGSHHQRTSPWTLPPQGEQS